MRYLTPYEIIKAHDRLIEKFGGSPGVRDQKLLESATFRCQTTFGGEFLYPDIFTKTAALFHSLIFNHPFVDGNKRTATASAAMFLRVNGWELRTTNEEVVAFPLAVEKTRPSIEKIASWLKSQCVKLK